jgi:aminoglycoside phosphotransferase family enzyme/predicted kinase
MSAAARCAQVVETHISTLLFTDDRVYKLAKRVDLPFLHAIDVNDRLRLARLEYEQNRRFAPDVYLGLADVREHGELVDHMVVMRRLPEERRLSAMLHDSDTPARLHEVARAIAAIHAGAEPVVDGSAASPARTVRNWVDNFAAIRPHVGSVIAASEFELVEQHALSYLDQCHDLLTSRIEQGFIRDVHGDLIADDIYCLDDGPRILDCLAFDDDLRVTDVLSDIAFLAMDVHRLAGAEASRTLMRGYHEFSNEQHPSSLAHHYVAYRAHVRAKIACLRVEQGDHAAHELARTYHARIRIIMVGGGPGVGKTELARRLAEHFGYVHLSTDEIRHDVARISRGEHEFAPLDEGAYDPTLVDATYEEQRRETIALVERGHGVVLDASWASDRHRDAMRAALDDRGVDIVELECVLDDDQARERIARRLAHTDDPSDATPELVDLLRGRRVTWRTATRISTAPAIENVVESALDVIERHL